jgi:hypothetical protein
VQRARRRHRVLSVLAFGLLALVAELIGKALIARIDIGRHVAAPSYAGADYYPVLLGAVKLGIALLVARLAWRAVRARVAVLTARRVLDPLGTRSSLQAPRLRLRLSPRLWLAFFAVTSIVYLVQMDAEQAAVGRWPLLSPWLHSSALPLFAVLAVVLALVWGAVQRWLAEYERLAEDAAAEARRLAATRQEPVVFPRHVMSCPPRRLFGCAFESRPPPLPA